MTGKRVYRKKRAAPRARVVRVRAPTRAYARRRPRTGMGSRIGGALGAGLGSMVGMSGLGRTAGSMLGSGIGKIFGSGKYVLSDQMPQENMVAGLGPKTIPSFGEESILLCRREYVGSVRSPVAAGTFGTTSYPIQPGNITSFPWLCNIASAYTEYSFLGLVYEFISSSSDSVISTADNTSLGTVVLSTNYDSLAYTTNIAALNSTFAVSSKISNNCLHMVECKNRDNNPLSTLYIRTGAVPANRDIRMYDNGNFQISISGCQASNQIVGDLYVSYKIALRKAVLPGSIALAYAAPVLFAYLNSGDITSGGGTLGRLRLPLALATVSGTNAQAIPQMNVPSFYVGNQFMTYGLSPNLASSQYILSFFALGYYRVRLSYDLYFTLYSTDPIISAWKTTIGLYKESGNSKTFPAPSGYADGALWNPSQTIPVGVATNSAMHRSIDILLDVRVMDDVAADGRMCNAWVPCFGSIASSAGGAVAMLYNNVNMTVEYLNGV